MSSEEGATEAIVPLSLGMVSDPPTLILVYEVLQKTDQVTTIRKRRKRKMPLRNFSDKADVRKVIFILQQRHSKFLSPVPQVFLEKMLRIIQKVQEGLRIGEAVKAIDEEFGINGDEDLNKIQPEELQRKKELMNETFVKSLILPGDPGYVYDKEVDFPLIVGGQAARSAWDEEEEDDEDPKSVEESFQKRLPLEAQESDQRDKFEVPVDPDQEEHSIDISDKLRLIVQERSKVNDESTGAPVEEEARKTLLDSEDSAKKAEKEDPDVQNEIQEGKSARILKSKEEETSRQLASGIVNEAKEANDPIQLDEANDSEASIENVDFESEEELPPSHKELSKEYDFKLEEEDPDVFDDDFWKF